MEISPQSLAGLSLAEKRMLLAELLQERANQSAAVFPLSHGQRGLWFLYQMEGAGATYNLPLALRLEGELDRAALEQALGDAVERHEALRTVFPQEEGVPYQKVLSGEEARPQLMVENISESELSERLAEAAGTGMELERDTMRMGVGLLLCGGLLAAGAAEIPAPPVAPVRPVSDHGHQ